MNIFKSPKIMDKNGEIYIAKKDKKPLNEIISPSRELYIQEHILHVDSQIMCFRATEVDKTIRFVNF